MIDFNYQQTTQLLRLADSPGGPLEWPKHSHHLSIPWVTWHGIVGWYVFFYLVEISLSQAIKTVKSSFGGNEPFQISTPQGKDIAVSSQIGSSI